MLKKDLRVVKTKKNLFNTLLTLLKTSEFEEITVTKLCEISEVNRSTFYAHYSNIDELFESHMLEIMEQLNEEYKVAYSKLFIQQKEALVNVFQHIVDYRHFYDVLFSDKIPQKFTMLFIAEYMRQPKELTEQLVRSEIDYELYYTFCVSATIGVINHWRKTGYKKTPLDMSVQVMMFFSNNQLSLRDDSLR